MASSIEAETIEESQYIDQFNKESLFFGNPKQQTNNITYFRIPIFSAEPTTNKLTPLIIKSPNVWLRTGLKEFNNKGKIKDSIIFLVRVMMRIIG